jgi:transposase
VNITALLLHGKGLHVHEVCRSAGTIWLQLRATRQTASCPLCGHRSHRVQSTYVRTVTDLPFSGEPVVLRLQVRRFVCDTHGCPRRIFAERFPELVAPRARQTDRARAACQRLAHALGGRAGARLATPLGLPASRTTLLRRLLAIPLPPVATPRVLGIDEWSWRRGYRYGTVLCDLERRALVDLLPDRAAETVAAWLTAHPGVQIISRDRAGLYADAARQGAPAAVQVADRWHLLDNLVDALERVFLHKKPLLQQIAATIADAQPIYPAAPTAVSIPPESHVSTGSASDEMYCGRRKHPQPRLWQERAEQESLRRHATRIQCYQQVHALAAVGADKADIARMVGVSRQTVHRYLALSASPERRQPQRHGEVLDPWKPYLLRRWAQGCHNALRLWREIRGLGFAYSSTNVARFAARIRRGEVACAPTAPPGSTTPAQATGARPLSTRWSPRRVAGLCVYRPEDLTDRQQTYLTGVCQADGVVQTAYVLAQVFTAMLRERHGEQLDGWIAAAQASGIAELKRFACGLLADKAAVQAGLTLCWSQGQVEGHVPRLKLVKRSMYGRAGFAVLRRRVLSAA